MTESTSSLTSLRRYGIVLRRQWWLVALVTVLALLVSVLYVQRKPSVYAAQMKIVVGQGQALFVPNVSNAVQPFTQTMTDLIQSNVVAAETIGRLHLHMTPSALISHLSVTSPPEASVLQVTYEDTNRPQTQLILATVGQVFTELVDKQLGGASKTKSSANGEAQANGSEPVSATVFDPAHLLPESVAPKTTRTYVIALALGLVAGILLALLRDALTNRIRTEEEAREAYQAPVIGALPPGAIGATPSQLGVMPPKLSARVSESLEVLAATLRFAGGHAEQGIILITSAEPEEGKSTLTAQISATLAQSGHSAIAVDADLRRAGLGRFFGAEPGMPGLADVLAGESRLADVLISANQELAARDPALALRRGARGGADIQAPPMGAELMFLSAGGREHNPAKVLSLGGCAEVTAQLREIADYVVIDTPPLLLSGDAFPLVQLADIVIVACRERTSTRDHAYALSQRLSDLGIKEFSVVLTEASSAQQKTYGYGY